MVPKSFILLLAFAVFVSCENNTEAQSVKHNRSPFNFSSETNIPSLFDSECAFKKIAGAITEEDCYDVHYNNEYALEILLPVDAADGTKYIVPFILDPSQAETTFSLKAQKILGMTRDNENFNILYRSIPVKRGEENILGLGFLDESKMALDFYYREVGIHFSTGDGEEYELNWPLESFKDVKYEKNIGKMAKQYQKVKADYDKVMITHNEQREKMEKLLGLKDAILAKLEAKKTELESKINKPQRRRRTEL